MIASAAAAAFFRLAASRLVPITALAASAASNGVSCRLVRPIVQVATLPPGHRQHDRRRRGGVVADLALQLFIGVAGTCGRCRNRNRGQDFAGLERRKIGALIKLARRDLAGATGPFEPVARAQRHHQRRHVVAGIAIGDIAADGAHVAHLRIGDQKRGFVQDRQRLGDLVGGQQFVLGGHRPDHDLVAVAADAFQPGDAVQVDQMLGGSKPKLHHRDQTVAAGERAGFVAQGREQFDRIGHGRGPVIAERARNHRLLHASLCFGAYSGRKTWRNALFKCRRRRGGSYGNCSQARRRRRRGHQ